MQTLLNSHKALIIGLMLYFTAPSVMAVCGDGLIDMNANGNPIESCDLGAANNNDPASLSGCDTNCRTKLGGWTCTNSMASWVGLAQTDIRSLKNLFISLLQRNKNNTITAANCTNDNTAEPCISYRRDLYEFKRLNVNNPINTSAKMRCMYAGDATPSAITLIDPAGGTYLVNCGTDNIQNEVVPAV